MNLDNPLLSVVIPTRNRVECAKSAIEAALIAAPNAQIIVVDSGQSGELEVFCGERIVSGAKIVYKANPADFNVIENFESALDLCQGEFVCYIGDDDLIGPRIEDVCRWAKAEGHDAVVSYGASFNAAYYWPGVSSRYFGDAYSARVFIWPFTGRSRPIDSQHELHAAQRSIGRGLAALPKLYHGLVSRASLIELKQKYGAVFGGVSPDIYSAVLLALTVKRPVFLDYPFVIPGASPVSEAGSGVARTDRVTFEESPYLKRFKNFSWDRNIPRFFAPYTVWSSSMVEAMKVAGHKVDARFLAIVYTKCFIYCPGYFRETLAAMRHAIQQHGRWPVIIGMIKGVLLESVWIMKRLFKFLLAPRAAGKARRYGPINDSVAALRLLDGMISTKLKLS